MNRKEMINYLIEFAWAIEGRRLKERYFDDFTDAELLEDVRHAKSIY